MEVNKVAIDGAYLLCLAMGIWSCDAHPEVWIFTELCKALYSVDLIHDSDMFLSAPEAYLLFWDIFPWKGGTKIF